MIVLVEDILKRPSRDIVKRAIVVLGRRLLVATGVLVLLGTDDGAARGDRGQ